MTLSAIYEFNPVQRTEKQVLHGYITGLLQEYCVTILRVWETSDVVFCCGTPNMIQKGNRFKILRKSLFNPSLQHWPWPRTMSLTLPPLPGTRTQLLLTCLYKERGGSELSYFRQPRHSGRRALTGILAFFVLDLGITSPCIMTAWVRAGWAPTASAFSNTPSFMTMLRCLKFWLLSSSGRKQQRHGSQRVRTQVLK